MRASPPIKIGIAGTGFIGRGLAIALEPHADLAVSAMLTRRRLGSLNDFPRRDKLTNSLQELVDRSDLVVECSGDAIHATDVVDMALAAGRPVVTMNAEFHVTTGSHFVGRGTLTEAEGDQPGCIAALAEQARDMGLRPIVYGNRKGYYHPNPPVEQMEFWARKQGFTMELVTSATDGTKLHIEVALVANGLGAKIAKDGLLGPEASDLKSGAIALAHHAKRIGSPISDYVLAPTAPAGVFVVVESDPRHELVFENMGVGSGPYYVLATNYHLCHLEIVKTIRRVLRGDPPLLTNSAKPTVSVAAIAKRALRPGEKIKRAIGSSDLRGTAILLADHPKHVPIGLIADAVIERSVEPGQELTFDDVCIPDSPAARAWNAIIGEVHESLVL